MVTTQIEYLMSDPLVFLMMQENTEVDMMMEVPGILHCVAPEWVLAWS